MQTFEREQSVPFHIAEFTALKGEVLEDLKSASANFQYAATLSGGIAAWLLSSGRHLSGAGNVHSAAYWLPLLLTCLLGGLTLSIYWRFRIKGGYLKKIEDILGFEGLGWQKEWARRSLFFGTGSMYIFLWVVLIIADMVFGLAFAGA